MAQYALSEDDVSYAIENPEGNYTTGRDRVIRSTLPDNRNIKVRLRESNGVVTVIDAFQYH